MHKNKMESRNLGDSFAPEEACPSRFVTALRGCCGMFKEHLFSLTLFFKCKNKILGSLV
jgi:hypothetical protein